MTDRGDSFPHAMIADTADVDDQANIGPGTVIWHLAQVREQAVLGRNCILGRGAYIGPGVTLGHNCKIQNYALIYEPARLEDGVFVGPAVVFTNDTFPRAVNIDGTRKAAEDWDAVGVLVRTGASTGSGAAVIRSKMMAAASSSARSRVAGISNATAHSRRSGRDTT